jgi:hypothetical protein
MNFINYSELSYTDISNKLNKKGEVSCIISNKHAEFLKSAWDAYEKYAYSYYKKDNKLLVILKHIVWLYKRAYADFKYEKLHHLTNLYLSYSNRLEPVIFTEFSNTETKVTFKLRK